MQGSWFTVLFVPQTLGAHKTADVVGHAAELLNDNAFGGAGMDKGEIVVPLYIYHNAYMAHTAFFAASLEENKIARVQLLLGNGFAQFILRSRTGANVHAEFIKNVFYETRAVKRRGATVSGTVGPAKVFFSLFEQVAYERGVVAVTLIIAAHLGLILFHQETGVGESFGSKFFKIGKEGNASFGPCRSRCKEEQEKAHSSEAEFSSPSQAICYVAIVRVLHLYV